MKILIVDDSMLMRRIIRNVCEQLNPVTIDEARNGLEAVEKCDAFQPDLVFMDITMPEMDGIEATKLIKGKHPHIKVVICSAVTNKDNIKQCLDYGANEIIVKPFKKEMVLEMLVKFQKELPDNDAQADTSEKTMHISIIKCFEEVICRKFGPTKWETALNGANLDKNILRFEISNIEDEKALALFSSLCETLKITMPQLADIFGDHWVNIYSQKEYGAYYENFKNAKDFLLAMDNLHVVLAQRIPNAKPPRFGYRWENDKTLLMSYKSHRGLIDLLVGLVKGVGTFYHTSLKVTKMNEAKIRIEFS